MVPLLLVAVLGGGPEGPTAPELWDTWPRTRFVPTAAPCLRHDALVSLLKALEAKHKGDVTIEEVGRSFEGRSIHLVRLGTGPRKILLWSQMHGDEPSATPALLDLADFLLSRSDEPEVRAILATTTLLMVPMLNPDGAERYQRRNAQGIDVNRDALNLATPEGRLLKALRERFGPELGFNLHDQNRRTTAGETGSLATISLLAVAGDEKGTMNAGRARAKRACAAIASTLGRLLQDGVGRYDEDWSPRAFGDNLTAWGTPVVLIESGGPPPGRSLVDLTRLNFVALYAVLAGLAKDDLAANDPLVYEALPRNQAGAYADVVLRGGQVLQPTAPVAFRADLAWDALESDGSRAVCPQASPAAGSRLTEIGDARFVTAGRSVDVQGAVLVPALVVSVRGARAREWLPGSLESLARLGVGTVRWHTEPQERAVALEAAQRLAGAGRPRIVVQGADDPEGVLHLAAPPLPARSATLGSVLDAISGRVWRERMGRRPFPDFLGDLGAAPFSLDGPASVLVVRPASGGVLDPEAAQLEAVWIDGREVR